jgi:hypothetical protein
MGCVTLFIKNLLPSQWALFRDHYPARGLHAAVFIVSLKAEAMFVYFHIH